MSEGFIKLHRKILDNPIICKDSDYFSIWSYLLLNATHKEYQSLFKGEKIILKPGQLITGRKVISTKFNINESKVQRVLKKLEIEQQIEQQTSNENRLITIVQWHKYQTSEQPIEQQVNNERTTDEQRVNTNKNDKNEKNLYIDRFNEFWSSYPKKIAKSTAEKSFNKLKVNDELLKKILSSLEIQKQSRQWQDKQYIPHASTYLNQRRWEDEEDSTSNSSNVTIAEDGAIQL